MDNETAALVFNRSGQEGDFERHLKGLMMGYNMCVLGRLAAAWADLLKPSRLGTALCQMKRHLFGVPEDAHVEIVQTLCSSTLFPFLLKLRPSLTSGNEASRDQGLLVVRIAAFIEIGCIVGLDEPLTFLNPTRENGRATKRREALAQ